MQDQQYQFVNQSPKVNKQSTGNPNIETLKKKISQITKPSQSGSAIENQQDIQNECYANKLGDKKNGGSSVLSQHQLSQARQLNSRLMQIRQKYEQLKKQLQLQPQPQPQAQAYQQEADSQNQNSKLQNIHQEDETEEQVIQYKSSAYVINTQCQVQREKSLSKTSNPAKLLKTKSNRRQFQNSSINNKWTGIYQQSVLTKRTEKLKASLSQENENLKIKVISLVNFMDQLLEIIDKKELLQKMHD